MQPRTDALVPFLLAALCVVALSSEWSPAAPGSAPAAAGRSDRSTILMTVAGAPPADARYVQRVRVWQRQVRAGIALRLLPIELRPLQPHLDHYVPPPCERGLAGVSRNECVVGSPSAKHVAVLTGDSHAGMFQNAVARALARGSWSLHVFQRAGCGWAGASAPNPNVSAADCRFYQAEALGRVRSLRPDVLLLSENRVVTPFRSQSDISSSLSSYAGLAKQTIVLGHTPRPVPFARCLVGSGDISRCTAPLDVLFRPYMRLEQRLATRYRMTFVDTSPWFCARSGGRLLCPPVIAGAPVFKDGDHVAAEFEPKLVPVIRAMLQSAGVASAAPSHP